MAKVLRAAGLDVGHETLGKDGVVSSIWAVEDERYPVYHHKGPRPEFDIVLHQVREPLATIGSLTTALPGSWRWNARHIPIKPQEQTLLQLAASYWYWWNQLCEYVGQYRYRIEDLDQEWHTLQQLLGFTGELDKSVSKKTNARQHVEVTWDEVGTAVPELPVRDLAIVYGYR
jgi:hypothetical protein